MIPEGRRCPAGESSCCFILGEAGWSISLHLGIADRFPSAVIVSDKSRSIALNVYRKFSTASARIMGDMIILNPKV